MMQDPTFRAVVSTIVPEAAALDAGGWQSLESLVEGLVNERPENLRRQLRLFLRMIEWLPVLRFGRRFTALGAGQRTRVLAWLQDHPVTLVRVGFWGLRTMALLGYYGRPEAAGEIGYAASARGWEARA
jgi:hypothetical protein